MKEMTIVITTLKETLLSQSSELSELKQLKEDFNLYIKSTMKEPVENAVNIEDNNEVKVEEEEAEAEAEVEVEETIESRVAERIIEDTKDILTVAHCKSEVVLVVGECFSGF